MFPRFVFSAIIDAVAFTTCAFTKIDTRLGTKARNVVLIHDLLTRFSLLCRIDLQGLKELLILLRVPGAYLGDCDLVI